MHESQLLGGSVFLLVRFCQLSCASTAAAPLLQHNKTSLSCFWLPCAARGMSVISSHRCTHGVDLHAGLSPVNCRLDQFHTAPEPAQVASTQPPSNKSAYMWPAQLIAVL
jgi:hypothetical protein